MKKLLLAMLTLTMLSMQVHAVEVDAYQLDANGDRVDPMASTGGSVSVSNTPDVTVVAEPTVAQMPFMNAVAFGLVPGYSIVNKFGHNPTADAGDNIWAGDGPYDFYYLHDAQTVSAVSTSAQDDTTGTGAHTVAFFGTDDDGYLISETVTMDGQTPVALTNTYSTMYRGVVMTVGSSPSNVGVITVTNGAAVVAAYIAAGDGQTQQDSYMIPKGKSAEFLSGYVGLENDTFQGVTGAFKWQLRLNNGSAGAWQTKGQIGLINIGSSWWDHLYSAPVGMIPELTIIRIIQSAASAQMNSVCGYDLLQRDNSLDD